MFSIMIHQLMQESGILSKQTTDISALKWELEQTAKELHCLSCMEEVVEKLKKNGSELEYEHMVMKQMTESLDEVILSGLNCEGRICNNIERN